MVHVDGSSRVDHSPSPAAREPDPSALTVDFVTATASYAPGLARVEDPLVQALRAQNQVSVRPLALLPGDGPLLYPQLYGWLPFQLSLRRSAIVHITNSWHAHVVPLLRQARVVTCHDLIDLEDLESDSRHFSPQRTWHVRAAWRGLRHADRIVTVSEATAHAIVSRAPQCAERIRVIHSGISPIFAPSETTDPEAGLLQPYVLYVGSEQPRKNLLCLVAAIAEVRRTVPDLRFVKVGWHQTLAGREALMAALRQHRLEEHTTFLEGVSDRHLVALYRDAAVTVLPSLQEGFGFPALEAMACGCPVVVSDRGALPEITGGAALIAEATSVRGLARAIEAALTDQSLRATLREAGIARARTFTWEGAAAAYAAVYEELRPVLRY